MVLNMESDNHMMKVATSMEKHRNFLIPFSNLESNKLPGYEGLSWP